MFMFGLDIAMRGTFFLLLAFFTIYSLFLAYHWFTYGSDRGVSMVALSTYLIGSAIAFLTMGALLV